MALAVRILVFLAVLSSTGCTASRQVWGFDRDQFVSRLYHGDYAFLKTPDYSKVHPADVLSLGDGAPYYLGLVFLSRNVDMNQNAEVMFKLAVDRSAEPWRQEAGYALLKLYLDEQKYEEATSLGEKLVKRYPESPDMRVLYTQALYWEKKDRETLDSVKQILVLAARQPFTHPDTRQLLENGTVALWRAASAARLDIAGWKDSVLSVFKDYPAGDIHGRLYIYLQYRKLLTTDFSSQERMLMEGKYLLGERKYGQADTQFTDLLSSFEKHGEKASDLALATPATIEDIARTYSLLGRFTVGSERLRAAAHALTGYSRTSALDNAGKLLWRAGNYSEAARVLNDAYIAANRSESSWYTPGRKDRILWYLLDSLVEANPSEAPRYLAMYLPDMSNYQYFSDLEENLLSRLVNSHRWHTLAAVYAVLKDGGDPGTAAPYAVVLAEAIDKGLYQGVSRTRGDGGAAVSLDPVSLLKEAASQSYDRYYRFLASAALDKLGHSRPDASVLLFDLSGGNPGSSSAPAAPAATSAGPAAPAATPSGANGSKVGLSDSDLLVRGYFEYGLLDDAYSRIKFLWSDLSEYTLRMAARTFADRKHVTESLRTMDLARSKDDFQLTNSNAELLYPQAFPKEMGGAVEKEKLSRYLFYALVREESYFDSGVASHAGAIGLSQLMPQTAADVARRMGLHAPNLSDPATNLEIGAWYLKSLITRFGDPVLALAAYNGGLGRVRQWQRRKDLPSLLLFHESIPIEETRMYIRKILVSAVYYAHLYQQKSLPEVVYSMFPDFMHNAIAKHNR